MSGNDSRRSQAQAACNSCRKRKSRCKFDDTDQTVCLMCKMHGSECIFPESSAESSRSSPAVRRAHKLSARQNATASASPVPSSLGPYGGSSADTERVSPVAARVTDSAQGPAIPIPLGRSEDHIDDASETEQARRDAAGLSKNYTTDDRRSRPRYTDGSIVSSRLAGHSSQDAVGQRPTRWNSLRRLPLGHVPASTTAESKCTIITQLIEPFRKQILDAYFHFVHSRFPLLEPKAFLEQYDRARDKISPVLLSLLYSHAIMYWRNSQSLSKNDSQGAYLQAAHDKQRHPDLRYIWDQADLALTPELHAPSGVSTIVAILLRISGRPFTSMTRSKMLLSSAISLAYTLNLNRNSTEWAISTEESRMRTRLWWAIVINDRWLSVTHGTPPLLNTSQHDVPKPASLPSYDNEDTISPTFAALASLCDVLDTYLDHVFNLRNATSDGAVAISKVVERQLSHWKDALPYDLRSEILDTGPPETRLSTEGSANLRLAYLYMIFIARKFAIDSMEGSLQREYDTTLLDYHKQQAISAAETIVIFVQYLKGNEKALNDFYLPFAALCMANTVAFLLRSAQTYSMTKQSDIFRQCMKLASDMIESLKDYRRNLDWDVGDICLARYMFIVESMLQFETRPWKDPPKVAITLLSDFPEVDQMAPMLWDLYNGV